MIFFTILFCYIIYKTNINYFSLEKNVKLDLFGGWGSTCGCGCSGLGWCE